MKNKITVSRLFSFFLKKSFVNFVILFLFLVVFSNRAYSFCIDIKEGSANADKALCNYDEVGSGDVVFCADPDNALTEKCLPFCDDERVVSLLQNCPAKSDTGTCLECNAEKCKGEKYYFVRNETETSFDIYVRDPQPGVNCVGYLPAEEEILPERVHLATQYPIMIDPNANAVALRYCSDLKEDGTLMFVDGLTDSNCLLKSCLHLSSEEMASIKAVSGASASTTKKQYCNAWQWVKDSSGLYKMPNLGTITVEQAKLKCYHFSYNQLEYLIPEMNSLDNQGYCVLHECSRSNMSLICKNDSQNVTNPLKNVDGNYKERYEEILLGKNPLDVVCVSPVLECPSFFVGPIEFCTEEPDGSLKLHENCDICVGVDKNLNDSANCARYNTVKQECNVETKTCNRTIDCGVDKIAHPEYASNDFDFCRPPVSVSVMKDLLNSWFYRPIPSKKVFKDTWGIENEGDKDTKNNRDFSDYLFFNNKYTDTDRIQNLYENETQNICMTRNDLQDYNGQCKDEAFYKKCIMGSQILGFYTTYNQYFSPPFCEGVGMNRGRIIDMYRASRIGMCGMPDNLFLSCQRPDMDSVAYIRGTPTVDWTTYKPEDVIANIQVCLRFKNNEVKQVCGKRECRIDCTFSMCNQQYCGQDKCVDIKVGSERCSLEDTQEGNLNKGCIATVAREPGTDTLRVRGRKYGRKVCVFLDAYMHSCLTGKTSYNRARREAENFDGRLDMESLFDNNTLVDIDGNGAITDNDVFGEYLYQKYKCFDNRLRNVKCETLKISNHFTEIPSINMFAPKWVTWDVIQYIGNNQPQYANDNCLFDADGNPKGDVKKCRGYYDQQGNFFREQQCFQVPLAIGPPSFYKYATAQNTPDLFMPLLFVESGKDIYSGLFTTLRENPDFRVDFFEPVIRVQFGQNTQETGLKFGVTKSLSAESITTQYMGGKESAEFKLKKLYSAPEKQPKLCLIRILKDSLNQEKESLVQCIKRANPLLINFALKPHKGFVDYTSSKIEASFVTRKEGNNKSIKFYHKNEAGQEFDFFEDRQYAEAEGYTIYAEKSMCSKLSSDCIINEKNLYEELRKPDNEIDWMNVNYYRSIQDSCNNFVEPECRRRNGNPKNIVFNDKMYLIKEENNLYGSYNEICVVKGFEDSLQNVLAFAPQNGLEGKCVLSDASKADSLCRYDNVLEYTKETDSSCQKSNVECGFDANGHFVKKTECSCNVNAKAGDDDYCLSLPDACFKGGFNANGSVLDENGGRLNSCICKKAGENIKLTSSLTIRKETPREAGLCVDLPEPPVCSAVHYKDTTGKYRDGGEGKSLAEIEAEHESNIWRTKELMYGTNVISSVDIGLGHAEFNTSLVGMGEVIGSCKGFWKNPVGLDVKATCKNIGDGEDKYEFRLTQNSKGEEIGCERYSCPKRVTEDPDPTYSTEYALNSEVKIFDDGEKDEATLDDRDPRGRFHGFAEWDLYTKTNDDIELRTAERCITGFGPVGTNERMEKYMPIFGYTGFADETITEKENELAELLIGYNKKNNAYYYEDDKDVVPDLTVNLPSRYCDQKGGWMPVQDIYHLANKEIYYKTNSFWHTDSNDDGIYDVNEVDEDGESYKYCERLYCPVKKLEDIVEISVEDGDAGEKFAFNDGTYSYPELKDINVETFWRHMGGAIWPETPASKIAKKPTIVKGECQNSLSFFTYDSVFIDSFSNQLLELQNRGGNGLLNLKEYSLLADSSPQTQPNRMCNNLGLWGPVRHKCAKACEMLDMYHTSKTLDTNQSTEIKLALNNTDYANGFAEGQEVGGAIEGDEITGGARWPRTLVGATVEGECDSTNPDKNQRFIKNPNGKSPMRECGIDGVWKTDIQNKCVKALTCDQIVMSNESMFGITVENPLNIKNVISWSGGDLESQNISENIAMIEGQCNTQFGYKDKTVMRGCDLRFGTWNSVGDEKCEPKTCGDLASQVALKSVLDPDSIFEISSQEIIDSISSNPPSGGEYYVQDTGLENKYIQDGLKGYKFESSCKSNYLGNGVELVCQLDKDGVNPVWRVVGKDIVTGEAKGCVPPPMCNINTRVEALNGVRISPNLRNSLIATSNGVGYVKKCEGYSNLDDVDVEQETSVACYENALESAMNYTCALDSDNKAVWKIDVNGCSLASRPASNASSYWEPLLGYEGIPAKAFANGNCNSGYTEFNSNGTVASQSALYATCQSNGTWSVVGSCHKNCSNTFSTNSFDCICSIDPDSGCNVGSFAVNIDLEGMGGAKIHGTQLKNVGEVSAKKVGKTSYATLRQWTCKNIDIICCDGTWQPIQWLTQQYWAGAWRSVQAVWYGGDTPNVSCNNLHMFRHCNYGIPWEYLPTKGTCMPVDPYVAPGNT